MTPRELHKGLVKIIRYQDMALTSRVALRAGLRTRNFLSRFSQSVDM